MKQFYEVILSLGKPLQIGLIICSLLEAGGAIYNWKKEKNIISIVLALVAVLTFVFSAMLYMSDSVATVPDLVDGTYQDAQYKSDNLGFKIEIISGHGQYVKSQSLPSGETFPKGSIIQIELEEYRSSSAAIEKFEREVNADYTDVICQLCETDIKFFDDNLAQVGCLGPDISEVKIIDAYLACKDYGVRYVDYDYDYASGIIKFKHVAKANDVEYALIIKAEGYEDAEFYIDLSFYDIAYMPLDDPQRLHLVAEGRKFEMASTLFFVDENKEFLPWFEFGVQWSTDSTKNGIPVWYYYNANVFGRAPDLFYIYDDYCIRISYHTHDGFLYELEGDLILQKLVNEDSTDYYIMINSDGTMTVFNSAEFWN